MYGEYEVDENGLPQPVNNIHYFDDYSYKVSFAKTFYGNYIEDGELATECHTNEGEFYTLVDTDAENYLDVMNSDGDLMRLNLSDTFRIAKSNTPAAEYYISKALIGVISDYTAPWE